jgi:hypothetical protein
MICCLPGGKLSRSLTTCALQPLRWAAQQLRATNRSSSEIALDENFIDQAHFCGISPRPLPASPCVILRRGRGCVLRVLSAPCLASTQRSRSA